MAAPLSSKRTMSAVEEVLERRGKRAELATTLAVADISMKPAEFIATTGLVAVVLGLVVMLVAGPWIALATTIAACLVVRGYVLRARNKRQTAMADQLPEVLQLVTTALRSGYGLTQALESVAEEAEEPARTEFAHVLVDWDRYLAPELADLLPGDAHQLMYAVGVIEVVAGLVVAVRPRIGGYLVAAWLAGIIANLLLLGDHADIALRDLGLLLAALSLARLATAFPRSAVRLGGLR